MPKAQRKKTTRNATGKNKSTSISKHIIHPIFHSRLSPFIKHLHSIGLDVKSFSKSIGIGLQDLDSVERDIEKSKFMTSTDKKSLRSAVDKLFVAFHKLSGIEKHFVEVVRPVHGMAVAIKKAGSKKTQLFLTNLQKANPKLTGEKPEVVRSLLVHSHKEEYTKITKVYQNVLVEVESAVRKLMAIEKQLNHRKFDLGVRKNLLDFHSDVRKLLHDSVHQFSLAISKVYDSRIKVYKWLSRKSENKAAVEKEKKNMINWKNHYLILYQKHSERIKKAYGGEK